METGIYGGVSFEDYRGSNGISVSTLKTFSEPGGPAKVRCGKQKETKALSFGALVHTAIMEPHAVEERFYITDLTRISEREKATQAELEKAAWRELVKRADFETALRIRDSVMRHPAARELLASDALEIEQSFWWVDGETGLLRRGRADGLRRDHHAIIDLKSAAEAGPQDFAKSVYNYKYHWQGASYTDGLAALGLDVAFVFIAVEKEEPYLTGVYEIEPRALEIGRSDVRLQLIRYDECLRSGEWPGLSPMIEQLFLPAFAYA